MKIGFLGLGVMGLPMAKNVVKKCGCPVLGYDVAEARLAEFKDFGGEVTSDPDDIYRTCDVVMQILPTHPIIIHSVERAIELVKPGNFIIDLSPTAPDNVRSLGFGAGMGLPNMKRCSDEMHIATQVGVGTTVTMKILIN